MTVDTQASASKWQTPSTQLVCITALWWQGGAGKHKGLCADRGAQGTVDVARFSVDTPGLRHEEGLGERGRSEGLTNGDFYLTSRGRCTLAPGKGGELGEGVGREWYLQVQKVTTSEKRKKVANCHASPVLPGAKAKYLQTAFPAFSRWEACKFASCLCAPEADGLKNLSSSPENQLKVGSWGHCDGQQGRGGRWRLTSTQVEQEKMILLNTDVLVAFTLMWCSVGWWIVPWPRQLKLKHWIQVLSKLGTSVSGDNLFLSCCLVFKSRLCCSCSPIYPLCHLWYDCKGEITGCSRREKGCPLGLPALNLLWGAWVTTS